MKDTVQAVRYTHKEHSPEKGGMHAALNHRWHMLCLSTHAPMHARACTHMQAVVHRHMQRMNTDQHTCECITRKRIERTCRYSATQANPVYAHRCMRLRLPTNQCAVKTYEDAKQDEST